MRVLFLTDTDPALSPTRRFWFDQMSELLDTYGFDTSINQFDFSEYDVAIIHKARPHFIRQVLEHSPRAHIGLLESHFDPPQEIVDNIDFLLVHTFTWRDLFLRYGRRIYQIIGYYNPEGKQIKQHTRTSGLTIGYHGNTIHYAQDFFPRGANALQRLASEHDFTLKIITNDVASQPRIDGVKTEFVEFDLNTFEAEIQTFDIGICPVFNGMEQMADPEIYARDSDRVHRLLFYGIPSVTSPIPQSCQYLINGEHALFAISEEGWYDALKALITQPELRNHIGHAGRKMVEKRFSTEQGVQRYVDLLNEEIEMPLFPKKGIKIVPQPKRSPPPSLPWRIYRRMRHISSRSLIYLGERLAPQ